MKGWSYSNLGAVVKFLSGGTPNKGVPRFWSGNIPWVSSAEMSVKRIRNTTHSITSDGAVEGSRIVPRSTIFAVVRGMSLAKEFRVSIAMREMAFNQDIKAIVPKSEIFGEFLFYYLISQNDAIKDSASEAAHGTKKLDMPVLENWPTPVPPLPIQRKIAAVLSAYDDLIENNNRRIELLEKMGEELYREWFVRLRFPGHDSTKIMKGVPEGWGLKKLPEIATITYGFPFDGSRFNTDGIGKPIIRIRNIPKSRTDDFTDEQVHEKYVVRKGDLLIGMDGEFHINHWYSEEALLVQRSCKVQAKESRLNGYLALAIRGPIKYFESIIQGATVGHLGAKHLNGIDILEPPKIFDLSVFNSLLDQRIKLESSNRAIQGMRDRLLTRLMSGKIDLEALDIAFPPSMQEAA